MSGRKNVDSAKTGPTQNPDLKSYMEVDDREGKLYPLGVLGEGEQVLISTADPESICTFRVGREWGSELLCCMYRAELGVVSPGRRRHATPPGGVNFYDA